MEARTKNVQIRLTPKEWRHLSAAAANQGLALGPWMRMVVLDRAGQEEVKRPKKK